jgi:hypothetical protein
MKLSDEFRVKAAIAQMEADVYLVMACFCAAVETVAAAINSIPQERWDD